MFVSAWGIVEFSGTLNLTFSTKESWGTTWKNRYPTNYYIFHSLNIVKHDCDWIVLLRYDAIGYKHSKFVSNSFTDSKYLPALDLVFSNSWGLWSSYMERLCILDSSTANIQGNQEASNTVLHVQIE